MKHHPTSRLSAALALLAMCLAATQAIAQTSAMASGISIAPIVAADTTPVPYRSAFEGYQPYSDEKIVSWKQANDTVGQIGGWRAYSKEASQDSSADNAVKPALSAAPAKP